MTWIIKKVNKIPMHCGVAYKSVCSLARGHVIRVCLMLYANDILYDVIQESQCGITKSQNRMESIIETEYNLTVDAINNGKFNHT